MTVLDPTNASILFQSRSNLCKKNTRKKQKIKMHDFPTIGNETESHFITKLNKQNSN